MANTIDLKGNTVLADAFVGDADSVADALANKTEIAALTALTVSGLTGTADGTIEDVTALSTSNTYTDAAVNAKITLINDRLKELATLLNSVIAALKA